MKKIIILASERSGTNLLRSLLGNHRDIDAPVAPHFLDAFSEEIALYGDLRDAEKSTKLLDHMMRLANHTYHDWRLKAEAKDVQQKYKVASLITAFDAVYRVKAEEASKQAYVCKDNHMFNYVAQLDAMHEPESIRYIYLYRDPRDNVISWMKRPLYMHTPYEIAKKWTKEQKKVLEVSGKMGAQVHFLKYEDLIENTEKEMTKVLAFIGLPVDENCFQTNKDNKESKRNEFWENLSKPVMKNNAKKYLAEMDKKDLLVVESVCCEPMKTLGYPFETEANWNKKKDFLFKAQQKIRQFVSKRKHRDLLLKKMRDMQDKIDMVKSFKREL